MGRGVRPEEWHKWIQKIYIDKAFYSEGSGKSKKRCDVTRFVQPALITFFVLGSLYKKAVRRKRTAVRRRTRRVARRRSRLSTRCWIPTLS